MNQDIRSWRLAAVLLASAGALALQGCKNDAKSAPAPPVPQVSVITAAAQNVPDEPEFIGQSEASRVVEIRSQVTGIIKERFFREGRDVKKGQPLYQIDPVPFRAALLSAKAKVEQAQAKLVQAKQNLDRVKPLLAEQAVSQKDVDDAIAEDLSSKATLESAKADVVKAQWELDNTLVVSPIDGLIERTRVYEGRLVSAQTDLLTIIHQVDPMYVTVSVPEAFLLKRVRERALKKVAGAGVYDLRGTITFADGTTYPHQGRLDLLEVGLRTTTGTRDVRVIFPNRERALMPGQFVRVKFFGAVRMDVILVPQRAVQQGPQGPFIYVVGQGDKVEPRNVQAANWQGDQWLIEDGLKPGERVILDGLQKLMPGAQVKPVPAAAPASGAAPAAEPPKAGAPK